PTRRSPDLVEGRKTTQRDVKTAQCITGSSLPFIEAVQRKICLRKARSIVKDSSHPSHRLFALLPSGRRYRRFPDQQAQEQLLPCGCHPAELCITVIAPLAPPSHSFLQ